jgi:hypothetical protein
MAVFGAKEANILVTHFSKTFMKEWDSDPSF